MLHLCPHASQPEPRPRHQCLHRCHCTSRRPTSSSPSADLTINLAVICMPADYNTRPLDAIYSNFIDALPVIKYCSENNKRLIHFSACEVYGKTISSFHDIISFCFR